MPFQENERHVVIWTEKRTSLSIKYCYDSYVSNNKWKAIKLNPGVKLSGVRQSKILSLAGFGRFGRQRVKQDLN